MYTFCKSLPASGRPREEWETQIVDTDHNHCYSYGIFHPDLNIEIIKTQVISFRAKKSQRWFNCTLFILKQIYTNFCYSTLSVHLINFLSFSQVVCCYILLICLCGLNANQVMLKLNIYTHTQITSSLLFELLPFEICCGQSALMLQVDQSSLGGCISIRQSISLAAPRKTLENNLRPRSFTPC